MTHSSTGDAGPAYALASHGLCFQWPGSSQRLQYPDLALVAGQHLFLQGPSGCGKSTLLAMLCGLAVPAAGQLSVLGTELPALSASARDRFRADHLGVIFQQFNLVPYLDALANTLLPCRLSGRRRASVSASPRAEAEGLLTALGLAASDWHRPVTMLSVGQQQRVAAARALIGAPALILADEPTSALDTANRDRFLELLLTQAGLRGTSVVLVSHDPALAARFDHSISLEVAP
ncbi:MAG: ABC transporter ATP-binding protein [Marinobacter sp.]|uniref:ABC transporter ATP-binding protein n=1 Tax=Marinobacter sp. TaxID=50741 RepID=UPI00299D3C1B|nr:ABC transporter ATP-binding protein [Marinobacter sp.]MDX1633326.1 ABC transporter ATP-binding protein [Marinobacter sp.]